MSKQRHPACPRDGFPMIEVDGTRLCSAEYADQTIGGKRVRHVREEDGYLIIEFESGMSIPLTCTCCGRRLHLKSMTIDDLTSLIRGRRLEGFRHGEWVGRDDNAARHPIFALQFEGEEDLRARTIQVHLDSVRRIGRDRSNPRPDEE